EDHGEDRRERKTDAVQHSGDARDAHVMKLVPAGLEKHETHREAHEECRVGGECVHGPSGWMACVTGPRRRASVRTSRAPNRLMITSRPRCGRAPPRPATSTKHSPTSGTPCRATCPPWHTSAAETPFGPIFTTGGVPGFNPPPFAAGGRTPASPCASECGCAGW